MKAVEFCYWLQGYFELSNLPPEGMSLTAEQVAAIRNHLALVFKHDIDPKAGPPEYQQELQVLHDGKGHQLWGPNSSGDLMRC